MKNKIETKEEIDWDTFEAELRLEREWRESMQHFSDRELLEIFPEAKNILAAKIAEWIEERERTLIASCSGPLSLDTNSVFAF